METEGTSGKSYIAIECNKKAIVLWPSLLTPQVINRGDPVEALILSNDKSIKEKDISNQLKFSRGLDNKKEVHVDSIPERWIEVKKSRLGTRSSLSDPNLVPDKFKGVIKDSLIDKIEESLKNWDQDKFVYSVKVDYGAVLKFIGYIEENRELFNIVWLWSGKEEKLVWVNKKDNTLKQNKDINGVIIPCEYQYELTKHIIENMNGKDVPKYCYQSNGKPSNEDYREPIQTYSPVVIFDEISYANIGHVADMHLCSRQHAMSQNPARVIEYRKPKWNKTKSEKENSPDIRVSPCVGDLVNTNLNRLREILFGEGAEYNGMGEDDYIDLLIFGGDIVDYIRNVRNIEFEEEPTVKEAWKSVELGENYNNKYQDFTDFISFYMIILEFYREYKKPVFLVSGNHDAYHEPYGISPRKPWGGRANPSIPGDHNMTFFESILCFGDTYGEYKGNYADAGWNSLLSFDPEMWPWFYSVFTPFSDFAVRLPGQWIVGLEWGNDEDVITNVNDAHDDGPQVSSHLPRSEGLTHSQEDMWSYIPPPNSDKEVILATHFTFVSYTNTVPLNSIPPLEKSGDDVQFIDYRDWPEYNPTKYDLGTFEARRTQAYNYKLLNGEVQLVLTGHSHRRGFYTLNKLGRSSDLRAQTKFFELDKLDDPVSPSSSDTPLILVSDSAGPLPGFNYRGEFDGHGRESPSGTRVVFDDETGDVSAFDIVKTDCKPRFVVALDYLDLLSEKQVIQKFFCNFIKNQDEEYTFTLKLESQVKWLASIDRNNGNNPPIILYAHDSTGWWFRVGFEHTLPPDSIDPDGDFWKVKDANTFRRRILNADKETRYFLAMKFSPNRSALLSQYDFSSYWCFPVTVSVEPEEESDLSLMRCEVKREAPSTEPPNAEFPDFDYRENLYSEDNERKE